ncbi:MAG: hypothetical protein GY861_03190 [bacterium]|nr:hypothetical protein [bacterium]
MANKKGTSTKAPETPEEAQSPQDPNQHILQFLKENNYDFQVSVFKDSYVHVGGKGFLFFDKPQLIYKAKAKNG